MVLCPYAGYCPNGCSNPSLPDSMVMDLDGEEWVPANGPMNTWVQIGTIDGEESTRCTLYHDILRNTISAATGNLNLLNLIGWSNNNKGN